MNPSILPIYVRQIAKQMISDNNNIIVLVNMNEMNVRNVYGEHFSPDISDEDFKKLYWLCCLIVQDFHGKSDKIDRIRNPMDDAVTWKW